MNKVATEKIETLDERIASVLRSSDQFSSEFLAALIAETGTEIERCDQTSREGRALSVDPTRIDGVAQRARAEDNEFLASRYRAGLERLKELHRESALRERLKAWHALADDIEARRDKLAAEFKERYQISSGWIAIILEKMAMMDREIDAINMSGPAGLQARRLASTECVARGIQRLGSSEPIGKALRLPAFVEGNGTSPLLWPLQDNFSVKYVTSIFGSSASLAREMRSKFAAGCIMVDGKPRIQYVDGSLDEPDLGPAPSSIPVSTLQEQIHAVQQERAEDIAKLVRDGEEREHGRLAKNAEEAERAKEYEVERRRLAAGRLPEPAR